LQEHENNLVQKVPLAAGAPVYQRESDAQHHVIIEELFTTSEDGTPEQQDRGTACWPSCKQGLKR